MTFYVHEFRDTRPVLGGCNQTIGPMTYAQAEMVKEVCDRINANTGQYFIKVSIVKEPTEGTHLLTAKDWLDSFGRWTDLRLRFATAGVGTGKA